MERKSGFHRIVTVDDGKLWYRDKRDEKDSSETSVHEVSGQETSRQGDSARVDNLCASTVEMCTQAVGPKDKVVALSPKQDFIIQVANYEDYYGALPLDELNRIINDVHSTEVQRAAAGNLRHKKIGIGPDDGNY